MRSKSNRILFLDIDGVLNTDDFRDTFGNNVLNPFLVRNLDRVVFETECKIVISSDWRFGAMKIIHKALWCKEFVAQTQAEMIIESIIDTIPDLGLTREEEILAWVRVPMIEVGNWVAVDDMDLDLVVENFVHTNPTIGLSEQKAEEIIMKLKKG
jgi:hypothetical protein